MCCRAQIVVPVSPAKWQKLFTVEERMLCAGDVVYYFQCVYSIEHVLPRQVPMDLHQQPTLTSFYLIDCLHAEHSGVQLDTSAALSGTSLAGCQAMAWCWMLIVDPAVACLCCVGDDGCSW